MFSLMSAIRDRSKFTGYLGRFLGKIVWKKSSLPPFLVEKNLRPLIFFSKKSLHPPDFFRKKSVRPPVDGPGCELFFRNRSHQT